MDPKSDGGWIWKWSGQGDKVTGYVLSVLPDFETEGLVFLGTDHGLYVSFDGVWYGISGRDFRVCRLRI